ncbi:ParB N-terminal domain-containing protein [Deinococcus hohokamensis]|uniref:ParB N-terminal domain-containing protein n=1 Tax=Deinococcus hohokamensis TaxID=309883 RepID=A0ABV9I6Q2_9DEIO
MSRALTPDVQAALRAATISEDGLTLTLAGQLDRPTYQATAKAIEALGGKWNRKAKAHLFQSDARGILNGVLDGAPLPKKNPLAFFATPAHLVEQLMDLLPNVDGVRALEPSAGDGAIAQTLRDAGALVDVLELDDGRHARLIAAGYQPVGRDFLAYIPAAPYPVIVMNPPFTAEGDAQAYIAHIEHAWTACLAPGGVLVAIAPSGFTFREDKRAAGFREFVQQHGEYTANAENAFTASGTGVNTVTLVVRKPLEEAAMPATQQTSTRAQKPQTKKIKAPDVPPEDLPFPVTEAQLEAAVAAAPGELPGTPVLITPADLDPGTLGLHAVPLHQTDRSSCNVRHHYDPVAIEELAASLKAEGQIENATGRWNAEGRVEIVAGESRRRAQLLRQEQGEPDLTLLVNIRELTDAEALSISATENMRRRNMTALEECEAMHRLNEAGRSVEDIAGMFGYKSLQPVADRILVSKNLHTTPRDLLDKGELSLAQAFVIARAPGKDLQLSMTQDATSGWNRASADTLLKRLTNGQVLVKNAKFDVEKSGLEVKKDLFDAFEPFFLDKAAALNAQIEWVQAKAEKLRKKGKHEFVHVITDGGFDRYGRVYGGWAGDGKGGLVFVISQHDGSVRQEDQVLLRARVSTSADGTTVKKEREISDSAYQQAHELRAAALRESVLGNTHLTLALTVWGLILGANPGEGRVKVYELNGLPTKEYRAAAMPELHARAQVLDKVLEPLATRSSGYHAVLSGNKPAEAPLLQLLIDTPDDVLLEYLNTLVSVTAYDWSIYSNKSVARAEYALLASLTDASQRLAKSFKLTDEWLKKYPRPDLVALAEEAGLGRALVEDCATLKEMRARILEHAERLYQEGFVPKLVQFPAPPVSAAAKEFSALCERATALIDTLEPQQINDLLDGSGFDHTDFDTPEEGQESLKQELQNFGLAGLKAWDALWTLAPTEPAAAD